MPSKSLVPRHLRDDLARAQEGDNDARNRIVENYLRLAWKICHNFARHDGSDPSEFIGHAVLCMMDGVQVFDPARNIPLKAYLALRIREACMSVRLERRRHALPATIPATAFKTAILATRFLEQSEERDRDAALHVFCTTARRAKDGRTYRYEYARAAVQLFESHFRTTEELTARQNLTRLSDYRAAEERRTDMLDANDVVELLDCLTPRQREVVVRRVGLDGGGEHTLEEVADESMTSRQAVHQAYHIALKKLRATAEARLGSHIRGD